uniref:Orf1 n=4 Tax=Dansoman virus TaxID=1654363 RepID=A0A2Z4QKP8_9VIRU|nr:orf1 [Dansoman virus]
MSDTDDTQTEPHSQDYEDGCQGWTASPGETGPDNSRSPSCHSHSEQSDSSPWYDHSRSSSRESHEGCDTGPRGTIRATVVEERADAHRGRLDPDTRHQGDDDGGLLCDRPGHRPRERPPHLGSLRHRRGVPGTGTERVRTDLPMHDARRRDENAINAWSRCPDHHCARCVLGWIRRVQMMRANARRRVGVLGRELSTGIDVRDICEDWGSAGRAAATPFMPDSRPQVPSKGRCQTVARNIVHTPGIRWRSVIALVYVGLMLFIRLRAVEATLYGKAGNDCEPFPVDDYLLRSNLTLIRWEKMWVGKWPPTQPSKSCVHVLETNSLAAASCGVPEFCGEAAHTRVDHAWWGNEHFLCVGTGMTALQHHAIAPASSSAGRWAEYSVSEPLSTRGGRLVRAVANDGRTWVACESVLWNVALYDTTGNVTIPFPRFVTRHDRIHPIMVKGGGDWVETGPLYRLYPHNPTRPRGPAWTVPDCNTTANRHIRTIRGDFSQRWTGMWYDVGWDHARGGEYETQPMPHRYSQEYSITWLKWLEPALTTLARCIVGISFSLLLEMWSLLVNMNDDMRVLETGLVMVLSAWYCRTWRRVAIISVLYPLITGWERK